MFVLFDTVVSREALIIIRVRRGLWSGFWFVMSIWWNALDRELMSLPADSSGGMDLVSEKKKTLQDY